MRFKVSLHFVGMVVTYGFMLYRIIITKLGITPNCSRTSRHYVTMDLRIQYNKIKVTVKTNIVFKLTIHAQSKQTIY